MMRRLRETTRRLRAVAAMWLSRPIIWLSLASLFICLIALFAGGNGTRLTPMYVDSDGVVSRWNRKEYDKPKSSKPELAIDPSINSLNFIRIARRTNLEPILEQLPNLRVLEVDERFGKLDLDLVPLSKVESIEITTALLTDEMIDRLVRLPSLRWLFIRSGYVEKNLAQLAASKSLRKLVFKTIDTRSPEGPLQPLESSRTLEELKSITQLETLILDIRGTKTPTFLSWFEEDLRSGGASDWKHLSRLQIGGPKTHDRFRRLESVQQALPDVNITSASMNENRWSRLSIVWLLLCGAIVPLAMQLHSGLSITAARLIGDFRLYHLGSFVLFALVYAAIVGFALMIAGFDAMTSAAIVMVTIALPISAYQSYVFRQRPSDLLPYILLMSTFTFVQTSRLYLPSFPSVAHWIEGWFDGYRPVFSYAVASTAIFWTWRLIHRAMRIDRIDSLHSLPTIMVASDFGRRATTSASRAEFSRRAEKAIKRRETRASMLRQNLPQTGWWIGIFRWELLSLGTLRQQLMFSIPIAMVWAYVCSLDRFFSQNIAAIYLSCFALAPSFKSISTSLPMSRRLLLPVRRATLIRQRFSLQTLSCFAQIFTVILTFEVTQVILLGVPFSIQRTTSLFGVMTIAGIYTIASANWIASTTTKFGRAVSTGTLLSIAMFGFFSMVLLQDKTIEIPHFDSAIILVPMLAFSIVMYAVVYRRWHGVSWGKVVHTQ